jgi:hypothetical protein
MTAQSIAFRELPLYDVTDAGAIAFPIPWRHGELTARRDP